MSKKKRPKPKLIRLLGKRIKEARTACGFTQGRLAEAISVEPETISRIERGTVLPSLTVLERLAAELDVSLASLLESSSSLMRDQAMAIAGWLEALPEKERAFVLEMTKAQCGFLAKRK